MASDDRPDPDALLRVAAQESRGRLKVFLGAAPGVGKTWEMLSDGAERKRAGTDVVVGIVETHGRAETEALTRGHEIIPRRTIAYQGRELTEMDIDAVLERHPDLVLVDELAHTNVPGSRHPKRYQDVEEILAAGIDVYSTINIQHIESLNDIVASFTHVRVRETVPDRMLESAEIEVVDIPPDELIERLKQGKVYVPHEATRALTHFFSKSNLSALRELALRRAAQTVDTQMLDYVRQHALAGNWAGGDRVVVAVNELDGSERLVRAGKRLADALRATWTVVHVETPRDHTFDENDRKRVAAALNLANQLGGTVASVPAANVVAGLQSYTREVRATQLILGKSSRSRWFELRHGSVVDRLVREAPDLAIHVLPTGTPQAPRRKVDVARKSQWGSGGVYGWTILMVAAVTAFASGLFHILDLGNVALLYLLPVMVASSLFGLRPGLFAGITSSLAYNFFFLPPTGTFSVNNPENVISIIVLLGVAFATSQFASRVRDQAELAGSSARQNAALAGFLRQLTATGNDEELMQAICGEIGRLFDVRTSLLVPTIDGPQLRAASPPENSMDAIELAAAQWATDKNQPTGRGSDTLTASDWLFYPLRAASKVVAVIGLARDDGQDPIRSDQIPLLMSLLDQAALVLERMQVEEEMRDIAELRERDRLRAALLSSVSHDLRTPLTSILGIAQELRPVAPASMVESLEGEAQRLNRFVANLLDMARVEAGVIKLKLEPVDLTDAIASAVHDTRKSLSGHEIVLDVAPNLPLVRVDAQLFHHCLINLLDNAGRYADAGTPITLAAERSIGELALSILDIGPGLPLGRESHVFETFTRIEGSDRSKGGTGLGLAIVKGFAEAMGLSVEAANRGEPCGARFSLHFPESLLVREPDQEQNV
ncbi:MAG: sensor histidine kinase KdpD [Sphingobium sp.]|jgi:two-component system sensor histidine kinase KdpD